MVLGLGCVPRGIVPTEEASSPELVAACRLAEVRCSKCHPIERVTRTRATSPEQWRYYVHRMRLQPGSAISDLDEPRILRCLVFLSFGDEGLRALQGTPMPTPVADAPNAPNTPNAPNAHDAPSATKLAPPSPPEGASPPLPTTPPGAAP
ncbi:MAG: hypothetical protein R3B48_25680 [Kofleriaceae bacterium]